MKYEYVEGYLERNDNGRWEFCDRMGIFIKEYSSGSSIEFQGDDGEWYESYVEAIDDYYIVSHKDVSMNALKVREKVRVWE